MKRLSDFFKSNLGHTSDILLPGRRCPGWATVSIMVKNKGHEQNRRPPDYRRAA